MVFTQRIRPLHDVLVSKTHLLALRKEQMALFSIFILESPSNIINMTRLEVSELFFFFTAEKPSVVPHGLYHPAAEGRQACENAREIFRFVLCGR